MRVTISTLPGNDGNFGTWLQLISLYKYIEEEFSYECSIQDQPKIITSMNNYEIFEKSFKYFDLKIANPKDSDFIILGSDAILYFNAPWYSDSWFNRYMLFKDINDNKKIIYAGGMSGPQKLSTSKYYNLLFKNIPYISFREKSSYEENKTEGFLNLTYLLDPVFLHGEDFYRKFEQKPNIKLPNNFNVSYTPHPSISIKTIPNNTIELYNNKDIGIREFIWMIRNCNTIYTTAYHGTIFGMIFGKKIYNNFTQQYKTQQMLNIFNAYTENNIIYYDKDHFKDIIEEQKRKSRNFLKNAFSQNLLFDKNTKIACYSKNNIVRSLSSSGGFCGTVANYIFNMNGLVYGATYIDRFRHVKTISVNNISDYFKLLAKSKYTFCEKGNFYELKNNLDNNRHVLFIGCPCQIKELLEFLKKPYENLITIDLYCHGYSDPSLLETFIHDIEKENESEVISVDMRFQHKIQCSVKFKNGMSKFYNNIGTIFINDKNLMQQCKICNMKYSNNKSDLTVGDFWEFNKDKQSIDFNPINGTNIVKINTYSGLSIIEKIQKDLTIVKL